MGSFGNEYPLFIEKPALKNQLSAYLQPNPKVINRYFADEKLAPKVSPDTVYFKKTKNKDSFRIFIQGGSTAAGFPYGRWGSLQGMLEQRFKRLYPSKEIEIINTAMAAVNSYTLLDFVDEIIEQQPDLVLIYAGHNEYLGIMGVGSAFASKGGRLATLLHLKFKDWRLYQLMHKIYYLALAPDAQPSKTNKTLMSQVAKEKEIALASDLYQQGIAQFEGNMSLILEKYQTAGIPVVLGNLVSNESGQMPFSSVESVDWQGYKISLNKEKALIETIRINELLSKNKSAENYYKLALNLQLLARFKEAKQAFILAKDHDLLRFRAPSQFNEVINRLANQYDIGLVDAQAMFNAHSVNRIVGNELILEHLHPTVEGYFLLAEAYAELIVKQNFLNLPSASYSREQARADIPVSIVDALYGDFVISKLVNDFPFTASKEKTKHQTALPASRKFEKQALIQRIENQAWLQIQQNLLVKYQQRNEIPEAAKIAGAISTAMIDNHKASYIAGQLYQQLNDWSLASYYHKKAVRVEGDNVQYLLALAQDYFFLKRYSLSLSVLEKADNLVTASSPQKQNILQYIANVKRAMKSEGKSNS
jgi:lysophospholipase L1-like esterase